MEKSTKKKLLIGGSILVIAGVGGFFLWKYLKKKKEEAEKKKADEAAAALAASTPSAPSGGGGGGYTPSSAPLSTSADILAFQKFANSKGEKLTEDGKWGPKSQAAWTKWGSDYQKTTTPDSALEDAIKYLLTRGLDEKILRSQGKDYVIARANALKANQSTFVLAGVYYDSYTGKVTSAPQPTGESAIGKTAFPKGAYANIRSSASAASGAFDNTFIGQINSPNAIGKIKNLTFGTDKKRWYEVDLLTPLAASTTGLGPANTFSKTGWVREDAVTIK